MIFFFTLLYLLEDLWWRRFELSRSYPELIGNYFSNFCNCILWCYHCLLEMLHKCAQLSSLCIIFFNNVYKFARENNSLNRNKDRNKDSLIFGHVSSCIDKSITMEMQIHRVIKKIHPNSRCIFPALFFSSHCKISRNWHNDEYRAKKRLRACENQNRLQCRWNAYCIIVKKYYLILQKDNISR